MKKVLSFVIILLGLTQVVRASPGPHVPRLSLDTLHPNVDSAYVDTNSSSSTYGQYYCRNGYEVRFNYYVISSAVDTADTTLYFDWTAINTAYPTIRSAFASIYSGVGHFTIEKPFPYITDTSSFLNKDFFLRFDSLLDVDSALAILASIPGASIAWRGTPVFMDIVPNVNSLVPGLDFSALTLNHSTTFTRYLHPFGWQWNIYKLHCPMAWEITMGLPYKASGTSQKYIHIVGNDDFYPVSEPSTNPDILPNFVNMIKSSSTGELGNGPQSRGDGAVTETLGDGHGHKCLSQAVSAGVQSMIGTCPECKGIAVSGLKSPMPNIEKFGAEPYGIDVDGVSGNGITPPEVEWSSAGEGVDFVGCMNAGIAVFSAGGNTLNDGPPNANGPLDNNYEYNPSNHSQFFLYPQVCDWPGYTAIILGSDPSKDVHPLCIGPTVDGDFYGPQGGNPCAENVGGTYVQIRGNEEFAVQEGTGIPYNFSCGLDKFSIDASTTIRGQHKRWAFMDVVTPASLIMEGVATSDDANGGYPGGYDEDNGTSLSAPQVAGIAGLMRSINYYVTPDNSTPSDLADVQRNINNIITFTANKIPDFDNIGSYTYLTNTVVPKQFPVSTDLEYTNSTGLKFNLKDLTGNNILDMNGNPIMEGTGITAESAYLPSWLDPEAAGSGDWQYDYVNQANDPLGRSWAQRVGFGTVNAYRAVANSIYCNGIHKYNKSLDLSGTGVGTFIAGNCLNENSKYLMHFGAWQAPTASPMDTSLVLQSGGKIIPNQSPAWPHLNQGETLLTSFNGTTATLLTVGTNDILAIDGLIIGDSTANHKIAPTSSGGGKILITGYLQNVEIDATATGPVKMDDLIMNGNGGPSHSYSNISIASGSSTPSEIYGIVQLQDYGKINVNGYLTIQPGGEIEMEGNNNFEIPSGGHVTMQASTTIATTTTKEVIVDNGATLEISGLLPVNVLCEIDVKSGGTLVIDDGADLQLNQFLIEQGGTFTCNPGGRLTLNLALYNYCYGNFNFVGISGDPRITLTGGVTTCGTVDQFAGIICVGNVASQGNAYMRMQYVDDSDVYMSGRDVPKDLFLNDYFSSSSALTTDFGDQYWYGPASLLYLNNSAVSIAEPAVRDAYLLYCRFFDQAVGATWHFFNGLNTYNLAGLYVNTSAFYNLSTGIETWNCPNASYYTNSFGTNVDPGSGSSVGPLQIGILDHSSGSLYCSNTISNCTLGISADHDMFGSLFDNTFTGYAKTEYCLSTQTSGHYMLRNNTFTAYPLYGIYSLGTGNEVILRDDGALEYGRNTMTSIRPFHSPASADLAKVNSGTFAVSCGLNTFGAPSIFQILNLDVPIYSINVGGNNWLGLSPVREHNCLTSGTPLNEAGTSAPDCGSRDDASPPSCGIVCCAVPTDPNPPSAAWFTLDSSSSELRSAATSARGMMLSDTLDPVTRALEARTELWAASLTDSFSTYLPLVLNDYKALLLDPLATPELKSSVWMLKGQLNEMLGLQDSAAVCYDTVIANYHQFVDSVYALWDLQRLGIPDTETLSTDSGEYAFSQREYHDLLAMIDTISAPDTGWGAGKIADGHAEPEVASLQVTVHPNPVAGIVKICVEDLPGGVPVTVDVVNQMGQSVATLYNATPEAELGLCLSLDCAQLPSGIYYADLQTGGFHHAVKFSVEH